MSHKNIQYHFKTKNLTQGATKMEMSLRHHTTIDKSEPKHTSMICTSFDMWSIGLAGLTHTLKDPHTQGFTCVMQSGSLRPDLSSQIRGKHQHHSTRANPHQKLTLIEFGHFGLSVFPYIICYTYD